MSTMIDDDFTTAELEDFKRVSTDDRTVQALADDFDVPEDDLEDEG